MVLKYKSSSKEWWAGPAVSYDLTKRWNKVNKYFFIWSKKTTISIRTYLKVFELMKKDLEKKWEQ